MSNVALIISASTTSTKTLQQYLDKEVSAFKRSAWVGSLFLDNVTVVDDDMFLDKVTVVDDDMKDGSISDDVSHESITRNTEDICRYLPGGPNHNHAVNCFIRLDPEIFPPSEKQEAAFEAKNLTYIKLRGELQRAAIQCGYSIVPKSNARFVCKCARTYSNSISSSKQKRQAEIDEIDEEENDKENNDPQSSYRDKEENDKENNIPQSSYRKSSWQYDVKNTRKKGSAPLPRKTSTTLPLHPQETCKFAIKVNHDSNGYYINAKYGCAIHSHHPRLEMSNMCYRLNLVQEGLKKDLQRLNKAKFGAAHGRNFVFANENMYLSKAQIRYAFRDDDASSLGVAIPELKMGSDGLMEFFNSRNDISYCIWGGNNTNNKKRYATDATFQSNLRSTRRQIRKWY